MKLIDLIVKHVPREKIHPDAKFFAQDTCFGVYILFQYLDVPKPDHLGRSGFWGGVKTAGVKVFLDEYAEDARTTVVTRDELMYAYDMAEITKVHFDTVAQRGRILCIFPVGGSPDISIDVSQDSEVSVENEWLTIRQAGQLVGMFRMENIAAWLIKAVTK